MAFLQPLALFGLLATAIPPLLHLISRRVPPLVPFPALRYLTETERRQSRRLKLRNLVLLILRMLIIAAIALAAARPIANLAIGAAHAPTALALVIDNSLSSGAIVDGSSVLERLIGRARHVLDRADSGDHLWLVVADGVPRRVTIPEADRLLDTLAAWPVRLDLSYGVTAAQRAMADDPAPGHEVVVLSDLQVTALSSSTPPDSAGRVLVWEAPDALVDNRGLDSVWAEPPVWSPQGRVLGVVGGTSQTPTAIRMTVAGQDVARSFGGPGDRVVLTGASPREGWHAATVGLDPDELRADDEREMALFVARPAMARAAPGAGSFVIEGLRVLEEAGRIRQGGEVVLDDRPASGKVVVFPPEDPALVGAVNRDLEGRGVPWRFGELLQGEWVIPDEQDIVTGTAVTQRYRLVGSGSVVARVGTEPWIVRDGDVIVVASRLDPEWTALPLTAGFVPFLDLLVNRIAAREVWIETVEPGGVITLPPTVQAVITAEGLLRVDATREISAPSRPGVYFLQGTGRDTVGALEVNHDPRESRLEPASVPMIRATFGPETLVLDDTGVDRELFRGARRADLTGPLLLLAILLAVAEIVLATAGGGRARKGQEADR